MDFLTFVHRLEENIEGTVHAETKRSNEFYKIQTFAQNLLARTIDFFGMSSQAGGKSEGTVHVETNGSNEFFRVQTFAKELNGQRLWNS